MAYRRGMVWLAQLGSSTAVIAATALVIAAIDAVTARELWWTVPGAGFLLLAFFLPALVAVAVVRLAVRGWWPAPGVDVASEPDPRRAAALIYTAVAAAATAGVTFNAALLSRAISSAKVAQAAATALAAVATAALLLGLAPLAIRGLGAGLGRLAPRIGRARVLLSRRAALTWVSLVGLGAGYLFYLRVLSPRLENLEFSWMPPLSLAIALLVAGHAAIPTRWPRWALPSAAALLAVSLGAALAVRFASPRSMLDMWVESRAASEAIAVLFDLEPLHEAYRVDPPVEIDGADHPDVVLITVDTWRADRSPPKGAGARMPELRRFARTAVRFDMALAPSNNTRRSLTSMMIGAQPSRVRGRLKGWAIALDPRHALLAERFRAAGYSTAGFFCCAKMFSDKTGFARGIDAVDFDKRDSELAERAAAYLTRALAGEPGADRPPAFVWIHLLGPHSWYAGDSMLDPIVARRRYDRFLARVDEPLGEMLAAIEPARGHAVLVLTSDHGEGLADHGAVRHSQGLYTEQLHVPLLIAAPAIKPAAIDRPVSLMHLSTTLLELAGYAAPDDDGIDPGSFAALVRDPAADAPPLVYAEQIEDRSVDRDLWAVFGEGHQLITGGEGGDELYDLARDPGQTANLIGARPDIERRLRAELERRAARAAAPAW